MKCGQYWPDVDGTKKFSGITIATSSEERADGFTIREMDLCRVGTSVNELELKIVIALIRRATRLGTLFTFNSLTGPTTVSRLQPSLSSNS